MIPQTPVRLPRVFWPLAGSVFFLLALTGCSLAGDIQPPPGYSSEGAQPVSATLAPIMPPDPGSAGSVYAIKCAPCHGETGMGDGAMADQLPLPAPAIGDPEVARAATPAEWFDVITNGRMSRNMPPFSASLSERQRWDMVAYVMTMNVPKAQLAQGRNTYVMLCQDCHGETGSGAGLRAAESERPSARLDQPVQPGAAFRRGHLSGHHRRRRQRDARLRQLAQT